MTMSLLLLFGMIGAAATSPSGGNTVPNADQLPVCKELPDPFRMNDGSYVKTREDWMRRRQEIVALLEDYEYGHAPAAPPVTVLKFLKEPAFNGKAWRYRVILGFGPKNKVKVKVGVYVPNGNGPYPVVLTVAPVWKDIHKPVWRDQYQDVGRMATERGYILAGYDHEDFDKDDDNRKDGMHPLYPEYDWGTVSVWAWGALRVLDYLFTLPEVDQAHVAITGHSRCGKTALWAAAQDERIALAAPHASGCGGSGCFRIMNKGSESLKAITLPGRFHYWFQPAFAQFADKEDRLPFDQHFLKALVAPRALLSQEAVDDMWANPLGTQTTSQAVQPVFDLLGAADNNALYWRYGGHDMTLGDWEALVEFADHVFFGKPLVRDFRFHPFPEYTIPSSWVVPKPAP
jgi:hypothetical protein